jgi:pimeloyl-ACP methyl ester carboxylesterase
VTRHLLADAVERAMDAAGFATADVAGNSLGGYVALQLAARGRAESVVAFAPGGGWARGDDSFRETARSFVDLQELVTRVAPHAEAALATPQGRRRATQLTAVNFEHIPAELIAHQMLGIAACRGLLPMVDYVTREGYELEAGKIECPVRIVWGTEDQLLPWPSTAVRFREWLPQADWVVLDGVGHCPQLDVPLEAAQLILGFTS